MRAGSVPPITVLGITLLATALPGTAPVRAADPPVPDAVAACRARHGDDTGAYVRCLEQALAEIVPCDPAAPAADEARTIAPGAEQLVENREREVAVRIVDVSYDARGFGTFRMEDGQVWRETTAAPERKRLAAGRPYTGRIVRGTLGGYRLHVDGVRWMMKVQRIE
ncbi:MAG TPA: hypothetical protein VKZ85_09970 [Woeseiaceae bacterium]|nr:hypothetical protein [Woeseiaceae bacterium]